MASDAILQRWPITGTELHEGREKAAASPTGMLPDSPGGRYPQAVEEPAFMKWGIAVGGLVFVSAAFAATGVFSFRNFIGLAVFVLVMASIFAAMFKFQTYFFLHADRVDMRSGLGDKYRIRYADIVDVEGLETGWLQVTYTKKPTLGFGGGQDTAVIRFKRHFLAPVVADAIKLGRDRARRDLAKG
jgi:hypothetical protein